MSANGTGRTPLIAGNWKMNKTVNEAEEFIAALLPRVSSVQGVDVAVCPPYHGPQAMVDSTRGSRVQVYAQNMHHADHGAFTGEVSAPMLLEVGVHGVILGHSERRELFGETDRALQLKVPAALAAGLVPILCVGETEEEREAGDTERKLRHQVKEDLARVDTDRARRRGDRLRADLGDRDRPGGHGRAGPGSVRIRPGAGGRPLPRAGPAHPRAVRRQRQGARTATSCCACRTSTARWWAGRAWTRRASRRSSTRRRRV